MSKISCLPLPKRQNLFQGWTHIISATSVAAVVLITTACGGDSAQPPAQQSSPTAPQQQNESSRAPDTQHHSTQIQIPDPRTKDAAALNAVGIDGTAVRRKLDSTLGAMDARNQKLVETLSEASSAAATQE